MIYTSRFQNPTLKSGEYTVVGIVRGLPRFKLGYERAGNIIDIAPTRELFTVNDREEFSAPYMKHLDDVGFERISAQIQRYVDLGKDVVLCCYEDVRIPNEWCHRLVFAEWWFRKTGQIIPELKDDSPVKGGIKVTAKSESPEEKPKKNFAVSEDEKLLIKIIYSLWTDIVYEELLYQGGDMYYEVDRKTNKAIRRMADKEARELIAEGKADVWLDFDSIAKVRFVLSEVPVGKAFMIDKKGKEKEIGFKDALKLVEEGKANIQDIESK